MLLYTGIQCSKEKGYKHDETLSEYCVIMLQNVIRKFVCLKTQL